MIPVAGLCSFYPTTVRISKFVRMRYMATRKTSVEIDEDLVEKVRQLLGTDTLKDTIEGALLSVVRDRARRAEVKALQDMEGMDLNDAKVMARAWRS